MSERIYRTIVEMVDRGEPGALATVIRAERSVPRHAGSKMLIRADGSIEGSVGGGGLEAKVIGEARLAIDDGLCRTVRFDLSGKDGVCGGDSEVFVEPILTRAPFVIMGLGHVGRALVEMGADLPYRFIAVDDRPEFLEDLPDVETRLATIPDADGPLELKGGLKLTTRTIVLVCNRSHALDGQALATIFAAEEEADAACAFIGMVGSRSKAKHVAERFADNPARAERFQQVQTPVGLSIGAETPAEIAISILAEIMALTRGIPVVADSESAASAIYRMRSRPAPSKPVQS